MTFRLVPKSVTFNDLERRNGRYFALFQRIFMYDVAVKQLLGLHRFQNLLFSERSLYAIARPSVVCLSVVCLSSVTFVRPTQTVEIFGNISTALGTFAIQ